MAVPVDRVDDAPRASDETKVSLSAATASGELIAVQKLSSPSENDFESTAAIGSSTITLRYVTTSPRVSPGPPRPSLKPGLGGALAVATAP